MIKFTIKFKNNPYEEVLNNALIIQISMGFPYNHPLGLPKGSVRATITLMLSLDLVWLSINDSPLADQVTTMTVVALTFYFGGKMRNTAPLPRNTDASLRAWGLPAGSIRTILILIFGSASAYLFVRDGSIPNYLQEVINIIFGYLFGKFFQGMRKKMFGDDKEKTGVGIVDHLKSILALGVTSTAIYYTIFLVSNSLTGLLILTTSAFLGFYFGARD